MTRNSSGEIQPGNGTETPRKDVVAASKVCVKCNENKSLDNYSPHKETRDKKCHICKPCAAAKTRAHYRIDIEESRKKGRMADIGKKKKRNMSPEAVSARNAYYRAWNEKNRKLKSIYKITRTAVISGKIIKECCYQCQSSEKLQAHHEDYLMPLSVVWLCQPCHTKYHRIWREYERAA